MSLEELRGQFCWLTSLVLRTDLQPGEAVLVPPEARHLLHHHANRCVLHRLTITGPGEEVEILAEEISDH
ncbi:hypothetical protein ACIQOV_06975 [Kitasatospora sp. NPDC091257]|uniref:hypothetical protein n=1 Tax=Kitasatospora sp. NPDC091257 TaxID=3364084 RepID=UPI0037FCF231